MGCDCDRCDRYNMALYQLAWIWSRQSIVFKDAVINEVRPMVLSWLAICPYILFHDQSDTPSVLDQSFLED